MIKFMRDAARLKLKHREHGEHGDHREELLCHVREAVESHIKHPGRVSSVFSVGLCDLWVSRFSRLKKS